MPSHAQLREVVVVYTRAPDTIETRYLEQIALMFNLDQSRLEEVDILHQTDRISVDRAVEILHGLPKRKKPD